MSNRAIVPFLKKYIPGQPDITLQYMPGGGGRKLANHMYKVARADGLTVAWAGSALLANFVLGLPGVEYDIDKLIYVGSPNRETHYLFFTRKQVGLDSLEKLRATPGIRIGAQSVGHELYIQARLFAFVIGLNNPRFVTGYSSPELDNALKTGELDSRITSIDRLIETGAERTQKDQLDFHAVFEVPIGGRDARFSHLPELGSLARSEREKKVLELWRTLRSSGQPYCVDGAGWWMD
jgi:tripartite-type tricarboxylate transporter receptor subunit TctC